MDAFALPCGGLMVAALQQVDHLEVRAGLIARQCPANSGLDLLQRRVGLHEM